MIRYLDTRDTWFSALIIALVWSLLIFISSKGDGSCTAVAFMTPFIALAIHEIFWTWKGEE